MNPSVRRTLLALVLPIAVLVGCSDAVPTAAERAEPGAPSFSTSPDVSALAYYQKDPVLTIAWAKKWIGPEGGRLDFQGFAIEVPAGAVDKVTQFSIRLPVDPDGPDRVRAEFGPHGATFAVPVSIELPYAGTTVEGSSTAVVGWWNGSAWVDMGGSLTSDGKRLRTQTTHFSDYGTMDSKSDVLTASG